MLKKEDWGGLTFLSLLAAYTFPPYFIYLMTTAALTATSWFWTTHLTERDRERFIDFEKEFREGYKLEKAGHPKAALELYRKLEKKYKDHPQAVHVTSLQIHKLLGGKGSSPKPRKKKA